MRGNVHRKVHLGALGLALVALPWSESLLSISQLLLVANWFWEGASERDLGGRFRRAFTTRESAVFLSFFGLHVLGLAWTSDLQWGLDLCRILLPVLVFGLVLSSAPRLSAAQLKHLLLWGAWSATASTLACLVLRHDVLAQGQYRELSPFISHIRLGLMLCFSMAVFIHYWPGRWWHSAAQLLAMVQCLWFLDRLSSLTAVPVLSALALFALWRMLRRKHAGWRVAAVGLFLAGVLGGMGFLLSVWLGHDHGDPARLQALGRASAGGEVYYHDLRNPQLENGHYVWINVADKELKRTWERRSTLSFDGKDERGQPLRSTLIRYLASMDLRKDSTGVQRLKPEDIRRIEQGVTSVVDGRQGSLRARLGQVLYEFDIWRTTGDPNGHSVTMRLEFAKAGRAIAGDHWLTGVGTGDTQQAFDAAYVELGSRLAPQWRLRAHNEYLTLLITFGVFGLAWSLFSWWWPAWRNNAFAQPLFTAWAIIFLLSCLNEDTIETQMGATFFALYYALFVFAAPLSGQSAPIRVRVQSA
ncbi:MAG: O-antigen ligase family protein [Flavobacteriales bacterium]|nr:O-antigen ligase family protein [Flavobacteriales bacterium]